MTKDSSDYRTYKDLVQNRYPPYVQITGLKGTISELLSYFIKYPIIGHWIKHSFTVVCVALGKLRKQNDFKALYALLIEVLLGNYFRKKETNRWWYLMRFAVAISQERQINWLIRDLILEDNLILIGSLGPKPWKGYDTAYAFVGYSLWLFERGDIQGAIHMIQIAINADETWGYPEYLYGWYGLFTRGVDSITHFARAVQIDWSFMQRMKQDRTCQQHPEVLREVQKRTLVSSSQ